MKITLDLPSGLAAQLEPHRDEAARIVAAGLRQLRGTDEALKVDLGRVLERLSEPLPPDQVLALRVSKAAQAKIEALVEKRRTKGLSRAEEKEWRFFEMVEHLVRMAKLQAAQEIGVPRAA